MLKPLWKHQEIAIEKSLGHKDFAFFMEVGTGKTRTLLEVLKSRYENGLQRTLIFCPPVVIQNWKREFKAFTDINDRLVTPLYGTQNKRVTTFEVTSHFSPESIFITNYESLLMENLYCRFLDWGPQILVFDESHKLKTHNSKRTKLAARLSNLPSIKHRYLLTGTPVLNTPMDLFGQYWVMMGGFPVFGKEGESTMLSRFIHFRNRFFYDKNAGMPTLVHFPKWTPYTKALEEINNTVNLTSFRVTKKEALPNLPDLVKEARYVDMTLEQSRMYKEMKEDFITYLRDKACVAQLAITKALRLMQIVSGFVMMEDGTIMPLDSTPREQALSDLLEELTPVHKVIVWASFKYNYEQIKRICNTIDVKYVEVHGGVTGAQKQKNVDAFNNDESVRVFIGHPGSGGIGINLIQSDVSIYFSRDFNLEHNEQSEARNHRGGSEIHEKITRIDLVTPGTIDELVLTRLLEKKELGEALLKEIAEG